MDEGLIYERGAAEPEAIEAEARKIWASTLTSDEFVSTLAGAGLTSDDIGTDFPFTVSADSAGLVVTGTTVLVGILSPVAKDVLVDVWRKILLPKLRRRFGEDVVGKEKDASKDKNEK